jgi:hypothetical protein
MRYCTDVENRKDEKARYKSPLLNKVIRAPSYILIGHTRESDFNIFYDDVLLNDVKYEKLLGITLDNCLSWC